MTQTPINYKETLSLPKTDFPMKANLPQREPTLIEKWEEQKTYSKLMERNQSKKRFTMPDGPPYANGSLHLGHVLNKVLKDIIIKYKNMSGYSAAFIPGWDCHGLPIELKVTKALGKKVHELSPSEIREHCRQEAHTWINHQKKQFKRLGILADWENPYLTLQPDYEAEEVRVFARILRNNLIFRGEKPVFWCPKLQTALAAAEVEYKDHTSPSIYVKFPVDNNESSRSLPNSLAPFASQLSFVIWTTTPWTLPANHAIAVHKDFEYGIYKNGNQEDYLIIAKELKEKVETECEITLEEKALIKGNELENLIAKHPFLPRQSLIILGDHVTTEAGTGAVHTAPGHGIDDYQVGLKYNLPMSSPVKPNGTYNEDFPEMAGTHIWKANPLIVDKLKESGFLLGSKQITHSYPHNPRSGTPLIFRATPQWFVKTNAEHFNLKKEAHVHCQESLEFVPQWGKQRLEAMVGNAPDWCLSRQRIWGVPVPVYLCKSCGEPLLDADVMDRIADEMESSQKGIEAYYDSAPETFIGEKSCAQCGSQDWSHSPDILDVWFDSGVCHSAVQKKRESLDFPADIYLEGSDQHRGWFQTSLMSSLAAYKTPPFKALITHGFVNDAKGHKMSKSKGNVIDPEKVISQSGAEILRLWTAYEDYGQDLTVGNEIFKRVSETYRRIRNTIRFFFGNTFDFNPDTDSVPFSEMPPLDQWALSRFNQLLKTVKTSYENYQFYKVFHAVNQFYTVDLSSTYLDIIKDRLYTWKSDGLPRRSTQTVLFHLLENLNLIMAPILPFLAEETYQALNKNNKKESVFFEDFPEVQEDNLNLSLLDDFDTLLALKSEISQALETLRKDKVIGSSLDAHVQLTLNAQNKELVEKYKPHFKEMLIVSQLTLIEGNETQVTCEKAEGEKCPRCWHYFVEKSSSSQYPDICPKCVEALS